MLFRGTGNVFSMTSNSERAGSKWTVKCTLKCTSQYYKLSHNLCAAFLFSILKSKFCITVSVQNWCSTDKVSLEPLSCFGGFFTWEPSQKPRNCVACQKYVVVPLKLLRDGHNFGQLYTYIMMPETFFWVAIAYWHIVGIAIFYSIFFFPVFIT